MAPYGNNLLMGAEQNSSIFNNYNKYLNDYYAKPQDARGDVQNWSQFSGITDFVKNNSSAPGWQGAYNAGMFNQSKDQWAPFLKNFNDNAIDSHNKQFPNNPINTNPSAGMGGSSGGMGSATAPLVTPNTQVAYSSQNNQSTTPQPQIPPYQYTLPSTSPTPINTSPTNQPQLVKSPIQSQINRPTSFNRHSQIGGYRRFRSR